MTLAIVGLLAAYIFLAVLLLNLGLRSPWPRSVKAGAVLLAAGFYVVTWYALQGITGWPSPQAPPERMRMIASEVREPDKAAGIEGAVFVWGVPLDEPGAEPRAYRFAYSPELHERITEAYKLETLGRALAAQRIDTPSGHSLEFVELPQRRLPQKPGSR
jgi:hypothetical protein